MQNWLLRAPSEPSENRSPSVTVTTLPPVVYDQPDDVAEVMALDGFRLLVRFNDGLQGEVDRLALVHSANAGVFAQLVDPRLFAQVFVQHGAVTWPGELDLAPDAMYSEIKNHGIWKLT
jgi:hypothetical protein